MEARGLAHECRVEATKIRHAELLTVTVDRDAMAGLLERCATSLEEMDATDRASVPALEQIESDAIRLYRQTSREGGQVERADMYASLLSELVISLCAYLKKEKAIG